MDVTAVGELLVDFTVAGKNADGYPIMDGHPGGAPANFLAALAGRGYATALIGKVGDDAFGRLLVGTLKDAGIETRGLVIDPDVFTTLSFVTLDESGDREFSFARKPGADTMLTRDDVDWTLIDEAKVIHFGTLSMTDEPAKSVAYEVLEYARSKGKLISFDPNYRAPLWKSADEAREQIIRGLGIADVIKISDNEVELIYGEGITPEEGAERIFNEFAPQLVFVTCGAEGCVYKNKNAKGRVSALSDVKVIDTTGAGDIFGGTAMAGIIRTCALEIGADGATTGAKMPADLTDDELAAIARYAAVTASLSATRAGGISSVPETDEIEKYAFLI